MKAYQLSAPPKTEGIYALRNTVSGHIYIGKTNNLNRRRLEWTSTIHSRVGYTSQDFISVIGDTDIAHWEFIVVREVPDPIERDKLEAQAIAYYRKKLGDLCLNREYKNTPDVPLVGCVPGTKLHGPNGPMTYREAADLLGCGMQTLTKRLAKWRRRGKTEFHVNELGLLDARSDLPMG